MLSINIKSVRLNLFNHVLALFCAKFVCNLAIRYPVFRWESCKGYVWESVKISNVCAFKSILATRTHEWLMTNDSPKCHTCETCRILKGPDSWSTTGQKGQSGQLVISRLKLAACPSRKWVARSLCFAEKWLFTFLTYPIINTLTLMKFRKLLERILREKTLEKNKIDSSTILYLWFLNSSTLTISIVLPLRGPLAKSLSHHTYISEKVIWCLGSSSESTNSFGWCNGLIAESEKLEKTRLDLTLLEQEAWRA